MKVLVTGGAGFIGSNFVYYLLEKYPDYKVFCLDKLTYAGNIDTLREASKKPNFQFYRGDIADKATVDNIFWQEKFDIVVNFAAESHVDRSISNPEIFLITNILGTQALMDASIKYGIKRYHQISTDEVYGDLPLDKPELSFTEQTPIHTSSPYSASKASADLLALAYCRTYGLNVTISRCSNNYGRFQHPEKLIPTVITRAMEELSIPVYGRGENVRDWLHVQDHCSAVDRIIHDGEMGEVYNVGGNNEQRNIDIVSSILTKLNKPLNLITYVPDRKGHDLRYAIDSSKIQNKLGWKPEVGFEEGLASTIDWYLNNKDWWKGM